MSTFSSSVRRENVDPIQARTVFEVIWTDTPEEVIEEVSTLWRNMEFGNDDYYYSWESDEGDAENYPATAAFLESRGVKKCLIHYWW